MAENRVVQGRMVTPGALARDAGLGAPDRIAPYVGALDPLLTELALAMADRAAGGSLYAATLEQAFAQRLACLLAPPPPAAAALDDARLARVAARVADDPGADDDDIFHSECFVKVRRSVSKP